MDKLENYRQIVQKIVGTHGQYKSSQPEIENLTICDRQNDNYLLMGAGWNQTGRVHNIVLHLRIRERKIWIEWDGIEEGVTQELLKAGVLPQDDANRMLGRIISAVPQATKLLEFCNNLLPLITKVFGF